jgi:NAD(P)-dependent dehydrogenase (short-subunit alcohol dehydrogenase family)
MRRLEGKTAIVTGAGSGIGRASAIRFAEEGARVVVAEIQSDLGSATLDAILSTGGGAASSRRT